MGNVREMFLRARVFLWKRPLPRWVRRWGVQALNVRFVAGAQGIILDDADRVLVLRHTYRKTPWGVPGGWLKREQPAACVVREVREETGLTVEADEIVSAYETNFYGAPALTFVVAGRLTGGTFRPSAEVSECRFCPPDALPEDMFEDQKRMIRAYFAARRGA